MWVNIVFTFFDIFFPSLAGNFGLTASFIVLVGFASFFAVDLKACKLLVSRRVILAFWRRGRDGGGEASHPMTTLVLAMGRGMGGIYEGKGNSRRR